MSSSMSESYTPLPSPPLSPSTKFTDFSSSNCSKEDLKSIQELLESPKECNIEISEIDILRKKYITMMEDGVEINDEVIPYQYMLEKLHSIGHKVINKKTMDALPLRVYETEKDVYEDYWVHPMFLSLQSFQFFKLFEDIKDGRCEEEEIIEIEVPSLQTFRVILYWLYTGDMDKVLEIAKMDESLCKGIIENINFLEINIPNF